MINVVGNEDKMLCTKCTKYANDYLIDDDKLCKRCYRKVANEHYRAMHREFPGMVGEW